MKSTGRHRAPSALPRTGAAALMVGGLVASAVTAASASPLTQPGTEKLTPPAPDQSSPLRVAPSGSDPDPAPERLGGPSLAELRAQPAADRSIARSAPDRAEPVETTLGHSPFTATTMEGGHEHPPVTSTAQGSAPQPEAPAPHPQRPVDNSQPRQSAPAAQPQPAAPPAPVQEATPTTLGGSLFDIAASYVGYPYVLYGTPPQAFDCSAYTWWVFKQAGIDIPRTVAGQKAAVTPVSDPQPGDLVFYNDWYHVGIYAGNGMTYEALNPSTDVRYGPLLSNNVWYGRLG
ncbi:C40 family peptidase [uncultured Serinicoccus sp.]|uniref:C40 family peptidase n=1 Tax=uncultured Serinicoccus sp. TaxID=735514 RepID=UPI00261623FA|nr:C40 family peptidase [uncultured Serinicoccus sp.]